MSDMFICKICSSKRSWRQFLFKKYALLRCNECGLGALFPAPEIIPEQYYAKDNYHGKLEEGLGFYGLDDEGVTQCRRVMDNKISWILSKRKIRSLLDVGCGIGLLVEAAKHKGIDAI